MGRQGEISGTAASWLRLSLFHHHKSHISGSLFERILSLLSPKRREIRGAPFCHSQQHNAWVCLPAAPQYCKGNSASPSLLAAQFKGEKTLSCPQSYPTATQPGDARFGVFLFRSLFTAVDLHTASRWFDSELICQRPQYYAIKVCISHF